MEPLTLYKLMILYLLKAVRYPLTRAQLSDFFLTKEYCTFFTFQQAIQELLESHLMTDESVRNYVRYMLTREGEETLDFFGGSLPEEIRRDMDQFLQDNMIRLRDEVGVVADYQENGDGEYTVKLEIREGKGVLLSLSLTVPAEEQAEIVAENWRSSNQNIYEYVMKQLLRD
ncbi:MAG: DUF4364 family protein [Lachnospiraceae bacterium]|nr:DUF4364 family protein [Lachnospiraceae bacterium]